MIPIFTSHDVGCCTHRRGPFGGDRRGQRATTSPFRSHNAPVRRQWIPAQEPCPRTGKTPIWLVRLAHRYGTLPNLRFSFSDSHMRLETAAGPVR